MCRRRRRRPSRASPRRRCSRRRRREQGAGRRVEGSEGSVEGRGLPAHLRAQPAARRHAVRAQGVELTARRGRSVAVRRSGGGPRRIGRAWPLVRRLGREQRGAAQQAERVGELVVLGLRRILRILRRVGLLLVLAGGGVSTGAAATRGSGGGADAGTSGTGSTATTGGALGGASAR